MSKVFLLSLVLCKTCNKCQTCCTKSACRGQTSKFLANLVGSGCRSESGSNPERGLHPPLLDPAQTHKVSHSISCYVNPHRNSYLLEALHQLINKNVVELVQNQTSLRFFNHLFLVPKPNNKTYIRSEQTEFLCLLTCQSADIMSSLCGVGVRVRVNNFFSKTTRPRDMLFFLKHTLSIEDEKLFKACKSVCSSVC